MIALFKACLIFSLCLFFYYVGRKQTAKKYEEYIKKEWKRIRNLDKIYFRVKRDGEYKNVCFTDMTSEEIETVLGERPAEWWKLVALHLKDVINEIADTFGIIGRSDDYEP